MSTSYEQGYEQDQLEGRGEVLYKEEEDFGEQDLDRQEYIEEVGSE